MSTAILHSFLYMSLAVSLPPISELPVQETLPSPFLQMDGTEIKTQEDWYTKRRPELKKLFQHYVYGYLPEVGGINSSNKSVTKEVLDGKASLLQVDIRIKALSRKAPSIHLAVFIPNHVEGPAPVFLGINKCGNQTVISDPNIRTQSHEWIHQTCGEDPEAIRGTKTDYWNVEYLIDRGYAFATFQVADIDPDRNNFRDGIHPWMRGYSMEDPDSNWGTIAAWAWGFHRAIDYLETVKTIHPEKIAIIGHSRRGKTALFAAAMDERVALVVPHQSGTGGMALSRNNDQESVERITRVFPHWFNEQFKKFGDGKETRLPVDQHLLTALVAPRPLLDTAGLKDTWANFESAHRNQQAASKVYEFLGVKGIVGSGILQNDDAINSETAGRLLQFRLDSKHTLTKAYWRAILDFADLHLNP
jgi:hypothetical protein